MLKLSLVIAFLLISDLACLQRSQFNVESACNPNPCANGQDCVIIELSTNQSTGESIYGHECKCATRFTGDNCEIDLCANAGTDCNTSCTTNIDCDQHAGLVCVIDPTANLQKCSLPVGLGAPCNHNDDCLNHNCTVQDDLSVGEAAGVCDCDALHYGEDCGYEVATCVAHGSLVLVKNSNIHGYCLCNANYAGFTCQEPISSPSIQIKDLEGKTTLYTHNQVTYTDLGYELDLVALGTGFIDSQFTMVMSTSASGALSACTAAVATSGSWHDYPASGAVTTGVYVYTLDPLEYANKGLYYLRFKDSHNTLSSCLEVSPPIWYSDKSCSPDTGSLVVHASFTSAAFSLSFPVSTGSCDLGYQGSGSITPKAYCEKGGVYTVITGACYPGDCGLASRPMLPVHAAYLDTGTIYTGMNISAACTSGYSSPSTAPLVGTIKCEINGTSGVSWGTGRITGACLGNSGAICTNNNDCFEVCINGVCKGKVPISGSCDDTGDCLDSLAVCSSGSHQCILSGVGLSCRGDQDCDTSLNIHCSSTTGGICGGATALCVNNQGCDSSHNLYCLPTGDIVNKTQACLLAADAGGKCTSNLDCKYNNCTVANDDNFTGSVIGVCGGSGVVCHSGNIECDATSASTSAKLYCIPGTGNLYCGLRSAIGGICNDHTDCSNTVSGNYDVKCSVNTASLTTGYCGGLNASCGSSAGSAIATTAANLQCASGYTCVNTTCKTYAGLNSGTCDDNADCLGGLKCSSTGALPGSTGSCGGNSCSSDSDCSSLGERYRCLAEYPLTGANVTSRCGIPDCTLTGKLGEIQSLPTYKASKLTTFTKDNLTYLAVPGSGKVVVHKWLNNSFNVLQELSLSLSNVTVLRSFTAGNNLYLLVISDNGTNTVHGAIYFWNTSTSRLEFLSDLFANAASSVTCAVADAQIFTVDYSTYLLLSCSKGYQAGQYTSLSVWQGNNFALLTNSFTPLFSADFQSRQAKIFTSDDPISLQPTTYMGIVVANGHTNANLCAGHQGLNIYKYNYGHSSLADAFTCKQALFSDLTNNGANITAIEFFTFKGKTYLLLADAHNLRLYQWDSFSESFSLLPNTLSFSSDLSALQAFVLNEEAYVAAASYGATINYLNPNSDQGGQDLLQIGRLFKDNANLLTIDFTVPTQAARDLALMNIGGVNYLAVASRNQASGDIYNTVSKVYKIVPARPAPLHVIYDLDDHLYQGINTVNPFSLTCAAGYTPSIPASPILSVKCLASGVWQSSQLASCVGTGTATCNDNSECLERCNLTSHTCTNFVALNQSCSQDLDCLLPAKCVTTPTSNGNRVCSLIDCGKALQPSLPAHANYMVSGAVYTGTTYSDNLLVASCAAGYTGELTGSIKCLANTSTSSGTWSGSVSGTCAVANSSSVLCLNNSDCLSNTCVAGTCLPAPKLLGLCDEDQDCLAAGSNLVCLPNNILQQGVCTQVPDCGPLPLPPSGSTYTSQVTTYQGSGATTGIINATCVAGYTGSFAANKYLKCILSYDQNGNPLGVWTNTFTYPADNLVCKALSDFKLPCSSNSECLDGHCVGGLCVQNVCQNDLNMPTLPAHAHYVYPGPVSGYTYSTVPATPLGVACDLGYAEGSLGPQKLVSTVYCAGNNLWSGSVTGTCLASSGSVCSSDSQCAGVCINGSCATQATINNPCDSDTDCLQTSTNLYCLARLGGSGASDQVCSDQCLFNTRPTLPTYARYVDGGSGAWYPGVTLTATCNDPLSGYSSYVNTLAGSITCTNAGTWSGTISGSCLGDVGSYCADNSECAGYQASSGSYTCANNRCVAKVWGSSPCDSSEGNADCPANSNCVGTSPNAVCLGNTMSSGCTLNSQCSGGQCASGICGIAGVNYFEAQRLSTADSLICVVLDNGSIDCSSNIPGTSSTSYTPPAGVKALSVGALEYGLCALFDDKTVKCWNTNNNVGQLDIPANVNGHALQISVKWQTICARLDDETVTCWGKNSSNLNNVIANVVNSPVLQVSVGGNLSVQMNVCVMYHNATYQCLYEDGSYVDINSGACQGDVLQVKAGYYGSSYPNFWIVLCGHPVQQYAVGFGFYFTNLIYGARYLSVTSSQSWATSYIGSPVRQVETYAYNTCVLKQDRDVSCRAYYTPAATPVDVKGQIRQIAPGYTKICVILLNGAVRCWDISGPNPQTASAPNSNWNITMPQYDTACVINSDCVGSCINSTCANKATIGAACDLGDQGDCLSPYVCNNGVCSLIDCGSASKPALPSNMHYVNSGVTYYTRSSEALAVSCDNGYVARDPLTSTVSCQSNGQWSGMVSGSCVAISGSLCTCGGSSCGSPLVCLPDSAGSNAHCGRPQGVGGTCKLDSHCLANLKCSVNDCLAATKGVCGGLGASCSDNSTCVSTGSPVLTCIPGSTGTNPTFTCSILGTVGGLCNDDADCAKATSTQEKVYCTANDAHSGGICGGEGTLCLSNAACASPYYCIPDDIANVGRCRVRSALGGVCNDDNDCPLTNNIKCSFNNDLITLDANNTLARGICGGPGAACTAANQCATGYTCDLTNSVCKSIVNVTVCQRDSDCTAPTLCRLTGGAGSSKVCTQMSCNASLRPSLPAHAHYTNLDNSYTTSGISAACDPLYQGTLSGNIWCLSNGSWSGSINGSCKGISDQGVSCQNNSECVDVCGSTGVCTVGRWLISLGDEHSCRLDLGSSDPNTALSCFGSNVYGELGTGYTGSAYDSLTPVAINANLTSNTTIKNVVLGAHHTCMLLSNGTAKCFGANNYGQLGVGNTQSTINAPTTTIQLPAGTSILALAAGDEHTCAWLSNDEVRCFGRNLEGELGTKDNIARYSPANSVALSFAQDLGVAIQSIAAAGQHTCVLLKNGSLYCCGSNSYGELGLGHNLNTNVPTKVVNLNNLAVAQVSLGKEHTCILLTNGLVRCFGANAYGQLGVGGAVPILVGDSYNQQNAPSSYLSIDFGASLNGTVKRLYAAGEHTCVWFNNGSIKCFGDNTYGTLGNGLSGVGASLSAPSSSAINFGAGALISTFAAGSTHNCAILTDGTLKCFGRNTHGELGLGNTLLRTAP